MRIDTHQHFIDYDPEEYPWMDESMEILKSQYFPVHLEQELENTGIEGTVPVQARQMLKETSWLLDLAGRFEFIKGVVGWVALRSDTLQEDLNRFAWNSYLKGVRHVVHDEPDDDFILQDDFNRGISRLKHYGLVYDILIFERHLSQTIEFVDKHPNQVFVVDHIAKPKIAENEMDPWEKNFAELAEREHVYCKLSGLVSEADAEDWSVDQLTPYFEHALEAFGPDRLMFGSDWPVCRLRCEYREWYETVEKWLGELSDDEQEQIWGELAVEVYNLEG